MEVSNENVERQELINELRNEGKIYKLGGESFRFNLMTQSKNGIRVRESGQIIVQNMRSEVIAHVAFEMRDENRAIHIEHKGYGESDEENEEYLAQLEETYGGRGIVSKATSLAAEVGLAKTSGSLEMTGMVVHDNVRAKNSRQRMERVIGEGEFAHLPHDEKKNSYILRTILRK